MGWWQWLSPVGIACLIAGNMCESPDLAATARQLALYSFSVVFGIALHGLVVLPSIYWFCTRKNPLVYMKGCSQALMTAFGTDSSAATLPVTILCCKRLGVSSEVCQFVLPLGATINMNGTALYEALTVIFIAQVTLFPPTQF
jgi:Na+/H+-dicarboxylate symporter